MRRRRSSMAWAIVMLRRIEMPSEEIRAIVAAEDPAIVHRYIELHGERLEERIEEQRRTLASLERVLTDAIIEHRDAANEVPSAASPTPTSRPA